jgi:hypothetical protein
VLPLVVCARALAVIVRRLVGCAPVVVEPSTAARRVLGGVAHVRAVTASHPDEYEPVRTVHATAMTRLSDTF